MTDGTTPAELADDETVEVCDNPERHRFDILVGGRQAGFSMYTSAVDSSEDQRIFYHTVIDDAFGGRGLAGVLTRGALTTSVEQGHRIVAVCPYVVRWLRGHDDVADSVDQVRPVHLEAVRAANAGSDGDKR